MIVLSHEQLAYSTADIEEQYFSGLVSYRDGISPTLLPAGVYRVVAGELVQVVSGVPPSVRNSERPDGA